MDVLVELVAVFADRELLVVVNGDVNSACADGLILGVVELCHVRMAQSLLGSHTSMRVELEEALEHVEGVIRSRREHVSQSARLSRRQRLEHSWRQGTVDSVDIFATRSTSDFHNTVKLVQS